MGRGSGKARKTADLNRETKPHQSATLEKGRSPEEKELYERITTLKRERGEAQGAIAEIDKAARSVITRITKIDKNEL